MKLYDIHQKFAEIWDMVENEDADLEMLEDCLQSMEGELEFKAENMVRIMKSFEADEKVLKEEADRLTAKRKSIENKREGMKKWLETNLIQMGIDKVKTSIANVSIANNPPSVDILDEKAIPSKYWKQKEPELSKSLIMEDLKLGISVPGATTKQTKGIRIR